MNRRTILATLAAAGSAYAAALLLIATPAAAATCTTKTVDWPVKNVGWQTLSLTRCGTYQAADGKTRIDLRGVTVSRTYGGVKGAYVEVSGWYQTSGYRWWHPVDSWDTNGYWHTDDAPNPVYGESASVEACVDAGAFSAEGCGEVRVW